MLRATAIAVIAATVLVACTSDGDRDNATTSTTAGDAEEPPTSAAFEAADAPVPGRVPLPGLLDMTDERLPDDPAVRTGTLGNGLRYYVRNNDNPGGKAELRLAVDAGSVDELGPTTGVAHFVEHMLFNGTEAFPENELIDVLRSFGASFGADINAFTSFDETVYSLTVPSADQTVELGLTILDQWLSHATIDEEQVVAERGVVLDEWRVRTQSTDGRLFDVAEDLYLTGSPYAGRSPIGTPGSITVMERSVLREFYESWYRPDNAAVVVVGDIDVEGVEADLERIFGDRPAPDAELPPRSDASFDVDTTPDFALHADPDQSTVDVEVTLPLPAMPAGGTLAARAALIDAMIYRALIERLRFDVADGTAPFDDVTQGTNSFVATLDAPALYAFTDADRVDDTLRALLDEYERANRFGFTEEEVDVARRTIRAALDSRHDGRDSTQDAVFADEYVADFLTGAGFPSIDDEYDAVVELLDAVTAAALDRRFRARWTNSAPHVIISTPEADSTRMPSRDEVLTMIGAATDAELSRRDERGDLPDALMERPAGVEPGSVELLLPFDDPLLDPVELTFPNTVRVILNSNDIVAGRVFMQARSPGGTSLVEDGDVVDALYATEVVLSSGVADFNRSELDRIIAGEDVQLDAWLTPYDENFAGVASSADVEVLFQLVHLYMTRPRFDPVALNQVRSRVGPVVADPASDAVATSEDAIADLRYPGELRYAVLPEPAQFDTLDVAGVERVWRDRFGNASEWVFVFSGDLDIDELTELAGSYLGGLPDGGSETWIDVEDPPPTAPVTEIRRAGTGDTASVTLLFTSPIDDVDARLRANAAVAGEIISARLTDVVRERLGDTYSPFALTHVTVDPDPVVETVVSVTGAPDRVETIGALVIAELADLAAAGPTPSEFFNAAAQVEESYRFVDNGSFLAELLDDATHPALELDDYLLEPGELSSVTEATVRKYVATHVPAGAYIQVTVLPR